MTDFTPRPIHAALAFLLVVACSMLAYLAPIPGVIGAVLFALLGTQLSWMLAQETLIRAKDAQTSQLHAMAQFTPEQWRELGYTSPPVLNIQHDGHLHTLWEGVCDFDQFISFLEQSTPLETCPERNWNTKQFPRHVWQSIYAKLVERGYVIADSSYGAHSFHWTPGGWDRAWRDYRGARKIPEIIGPETNIYQAETERT